MSGSYFTTTDGVWFEPTDHARGPWDPDSCHAGPPAGLLARASERLLPDQPLVRITVDLLRPIPHAGFRIEADVARRGRTVSTTAVTLTDESGKTVATARGMHVAASPVGNLPTEPGTSHRLDDARPGRFPIGPFAHDLPMFCGPGLEVRYPPGESAEPGATTMWMRTLPLLPDEPPSPFQRLCPLADCGNAISRLEEPGRLAFVNTDLIIAMHRPPVGEWIGSDAVSHWHPSGHGLADALLFDEEGPVGRALQTLILQLAGSS